MAVFNAAILLKNKKNSFSTRNKVSIPPYSNMILKISLYYLLSMKQQQKKLLR